MAVGEPRALGVHRGHAKRAPASMCCESGEAQASSVALPSALSRARC